MFEINEDKTINITRGDIGAFTVDVLNEAGEKYLFQKGDVVRIKVTEKKACENVMFQKDFVVEEETEQVEILLTEEETKIGEVISKPTDYWYEIELNPLTNPQTIIGYDEDGAKILRLYPEGNDIEPVEPTPEDIPVVDEELDITSERPVQNQAVTRAMLNLQEEIERVEDTKNITSEDLEPLAVGIEENKGNIAKNTGNIEDLLAHAKNTSNPHNVTAEQISIDKNTSGLNSDNVQGAIDEVSRTLGYTVSKNQLKLSGSVGETLTGGGGTLSITKTSENIYTFNGVFSTSYVEMGYTFTRATSEQPNNFLTLNPNKEYILSVESEGTINTLPSNDAFMLNIGCDIDGTIINNSFTITGAGKQSITLANVKGINRVYVKTISGLDVTNFALKIMLRDADVEDDTFEPYVADVQTQLNTCIRAVTQIHSLTDITANTPKTGTFTPNIPSGATLMGRCVNSLEGNYNTNTIVLASFVGNLTNNVFVVKATGAISTLYVYITYFYTI